MQRNYALDGLRGLLLCVIAINHLGGEYIRKITGEPFGFISAAEGFVFLSGLVAAMVYSKHLSQPSFLVKKIYKRVAVIYAFAMAGVIVMFLLTISPFVPQQLHDVWAQFFIPNWYNHPFDTFILNALQLHQTSYHDILVVYIVPMLFLPWILKALDKGLVSLVLGISVALWVAAQFIETKHGAPIFNALNPELAVSMGYLDVFAWQLLFVVGACIGFYGKQHNKQFISQNLFVNLSVLAIGLALMYSRHFHYGDLQEIKFFGVALVDTPSLGVLRLINVAIVIYLVSWLINKAPVLFRMPYFVFLGQHSLQVFVFHSVMVYFLMVMLFPVKDIWYMDFAYSFGFVASLSIPALLHKYYRKLRAPKQPQTQPA